MPIQFPTGKTPELEQFAADMSNQVGQSYDLTRVSQIKAMDGDVIALVQPDQKGMDAIPSDESVRFLKSLFSDVLDLSPKYFDKKTSGIEKFTYTQKEPQKAQVNYPLPSQHKSIFRLLNRNPDQDHILMDMSHQRTVVVDFKTNQVTETVKRQCLDANIVRK